MTPEPGIEPGPHWWEANALTTAPSLLPQLRASVYTESAESATRQTSCYGLTLQTFKCKGNRRNKIL